MCQFSGVPMEEGDHSECSIELLSCPEHRADQMRAMGYEPDYVIPCPPEGSERSPLFTQGQCHRGLCSFLTFSIDFTIRPGEACVLEHLLEFAKFSQACTATDAPGG